MFGILPLQNMLEKRYVLPGTLRTFATNKGEKLYFLNIINVLDIIRLAYSEK